MTLTANAQADMPNAPMINTPASLPTMKPIPPPPSLAEQQAITAMHISKRLATELKKLGIV
jgi:hypothetical protein